MFESIGRSFELMKNAWRVLMLDKELITFPILSGIFSLFALATFVLPLLVVNVFADNTPLPYLTLFLFYVVASFITIFFNVALIGCVRIRLNGGDPKVKDGLSVAASRLPAILGWAVIAATVGMLLRALSGKRGSNVVGRIAASILGGAWNILTYFVSPVIAAENVGPIDAIKRSISIVKDKLGETAVGSLGFGAIIALTIVAGIVIGAIGTFILGALLGAAGFAIGIGLTLALVTVLLIVTSTLNTIFVAALYHYATTGTEPANWSMNAVVTQAKTGAPKK